MGMNAYLNVHFAWFGEAKLIYKFVCMLVCMYGILTSLHTSNRICVCLSVPNDLCRTAEPIWSSFLKSPGKFEIILVEGSSTFPRIITLRKKIDPPPPPKKMGHHNQRPPLSSPILSASKGI